MRTHVFIVTVLLGVILAAPVDARRLELQVPAAEIATDLWGPVEIHVRDYRDVVPPHEDGDLIGSGRVFSFFKLIALGIGSDRQPMHVEFRSVPDLLTVLVSDTAGGVGIHAVGATAEPPRARLDVDVEQFWCDNPARDDELCEAKLQLELRDAAEGLVRWSTELRYTSAGWDGGRRAESYNHMLRVLADDLFDAMDADDLLGVLQGLGAQVVPPVRRRAGTVPRVGPGEITLLGRKDRIVNPTEYVGGKQGRKAWRNLKLELDGERLSIPDGLTVLQDAELVHRHEVLLAQKVELEAYGRAHALAGIASGFVGLGMLIASGWIGLTRPDPQVNAVGYADSVGAEIGTRIIGVTGIVLSVPLVGVGAKNWHRAGRYAYHLRRNGWELLHSRGEIARAVLRHNRRVKGARGR